MNRIFTYLSVLVAVLILNACDNSGKQIPENTATSDNNSAREMLQRQLAGKKIRGLKRLSEYGFFEGSLADMNPADGVFPYDLNTALFSDYAWKSRFIRLPKGQKAIFRANNEPLDFPVGTHIIKTFYYPNDFRAPGQGRRLLETRVLIREADEWLALPYIWNDEQSEAYLDINGKTIAVEWRHDDGRLRSAEYSVPTMAQCASCHLRDEKLVPIGPRPDHLNREFDFSDGRRNQLAKMVETGMLQGLPALKTVPQTPVWDQPDSAPLHERALAYMAVNCGHCHNPRGPGNSSALNLTMAETRPFHLGINKMPVAAGRGTGNRPYDITPGEPDQSILLYRMESVDPGIMMPELGRSLVHAEGAALIREWIEEIDDL